MIKKPKKETKNEREPAKTDAEKSPWGISSGAEDSGKYPGFMPVMRDAGVTWIRYFPEWDTIQPAKGKWNWEWADKFVRFNKKAGVEVSGIFLYFARWASSDGGTRGFPVKNIADWEAFVSACVTRYKDDITYWEIWNEGNSPAFNKHGSPKDYADMIRAAYKAGKRANPKAKFAITCAAFDLHYFDQVIKAGAAGHFDYICIHPYNSVGYVFGSEHLYMAMAGNVRNMLAANNQDAKMPIWMTETGLTTTDTPEQQRRQANALVRTYVLNLAQGIGKTFWFEACGPKYGEGVHAILTDDFKPRAAYDAYAKMTKALGVNPQYLGWLREGEKLSFAFGVGGEVVTVSWEGDSDPVYKRVKRLGHMNSPLIPLGYDWSKAKEVWCELGETNKEHGLRQGNNNPRTDGVTVAGISKKHTFRRTDLINRRPFIYFDIDPTFAGWNDAKFEITVTARRAMPDVPTVCTIVYESKTGYHEYGKRITTPGLNVEMLFENEKFRAPELWHLEPGTKWQKHVWKIKDARFIGKWGWRLELNAEMSAGDIEVREVKIKKFRVDRVDNIDSFDTPCFSTKPKNKCTNNSSLSPRLRLRLRWRNNCPNPFRRDRDSM